MTKYLIVKGAVKEENKSQEYRWLCDSANAPGELGIDVIYTRICFTRCIYAQQLLFRGKENGLEPWAYLLGEPGCHERHLESVAVRVQRIERVWTHGAQHRVHASAELAADCNMQNRHSFRYRRTIAQR